MPASARARSIPSPKKCSPRCAPDWAATRSPSSTPIRSGRMHPTSSSRKPDPMTENQPPRRQKKPEPCSFVIFGVTGDLAHRLVIPALYNLAAADLLPDKFCVVGVARKGMSNDELRDSLLKGLRQFATRPVDEAIAQRLLQCVTGIEGDPNEPASFDAMRERIEKLEANRSTGGNRLFYLATPT